MGRPRSYLKKVMWGLWRMGFTQLAVVSPSFASLEARGNSLLNGPTCLCFKSFVTSASARERWLFTLLEERFGSVPRSGRRIRRTAHRW